MDAPQIDPRQVADRPIATGTGYGRQRPSYDAELIEAGPAKRPWVKFCAATGNR